MKITQELVDMYLQHCRWQKGLNAKTLKAYRIDLAQFMKFMGENDLDRSSVNHFIAWLHKTYKPKSTKRKLASVKAFCTYLAYEGILVENPFDHMRIKINEPRRLPRTIPLAEIEGILSAAYERSVQTDLTQHQYRFATRDVAVIELLFATGIRVSELCGLKSEDVNLAEGIIKIYGKGARERMIQIGNPSVLKALQEYRANFDEEIANTGYFFLNRCGRKLSEQSVRSMIQQYAESAKVPIHVTPHMFRHSFATYLLEEDVDIRYIQVLLGHSSIVTTQIYTQVASKKQRDLLAQKHPRNKILL